MLVALQGTHAGISLVVGGQRIDELWNFDNARDGDSAELGVLADQLFTRGEVDAEDLVACHVAVLPLDTVADLLDGAIRGPGGTAQFHDRHAAHARNIALNQVSPQVRHDFAPSWLIFRRTRAILKLRVLVRAKGNL